MDHRQFEKPLFLVRIRKGCFVYSPTFSVFFCFSSDSLEPTYQQLQKMKLDKSPFVVVSVVGQELLTAGHHGASVVVLEAALKIGTCSLKLRGSVFSALSSAYWSLGNTEKSTGYMQQDLDVAKTLGRVMFFSFIWVQKGRKRINLTWMGLKCAMKTCAVKSDSTSRTFRVLEYSSLQGFSFNKISVFQKDKRYGWTCTLPSQRYGLPDLISQMVVFVGSFT